MFYFDLIRLQYAKFRDAFMHHLVLSRINQKTGSTDLALAIKHCKTTMYCTSGVPKGGYGGVRTPHWQPQVLLSRAVAIMSCLCVR